MVSNNILPLVLCVPLPLTDAVTETQRYKVCKKLCEQYKIPLVTLDLTKATDAGIVFEGLHTKGEGASFIADELLKAFHTLHIKKSLMRLQPLKRLPLPSFTFKSIDELSVSPWRSIEFALKCDPPLRLKIIQRQNIGPFSPVLKVSTLDAQTNAVLSSKIVSIWDRYCYYQRSSFVVLCDIVLPKQSGAVKIEVSSDAPDYKKCTKFAGTWPSSNQRKIDPISQPFIVAEGKLEVINLSVEHPN